MWLPIPTISQMTIASFGTLQINEGATLMIESDIGKDLMDQVNFFFGSLSSFFL